MRKNKPNGNNSQAQDCMHERLVNRGICKSNETTAVIPDLYGATSPLNAPLLWVAKNKKSESVGKNKGDAIKQNILRIMSSEGSNNKKMLDLLRWVAREKNHEVRAVVKKAVDRMINESIKIGLESKRSKAQGDRNVKDLIKRGRDAWSRVDMVNVRYVFPDID